MASVAHAIGMAQQRDTTIALSQPRGLDRKLRSELIVFSVVSFCQTHIGVARKGEKVCVISRPKGGTYTDRTSLVKPALVDFECYMASSLRLKSLASMSVVRSTVGHSGGPVVSCLLSLPW